MQTSNDGCKIKNIGGKWLVGSHVEACILKFRCPTEEEYSNDDSRIENLAVLKKFLSPAPDGAEVLKSQVSERPSIVLSPELSFGSSRISISISFNFTSFFPLWV